MNNNNDSAWNKSAAPAFWGEIAPCEHVLQIYENDDVFLNTLTSFVSNGIHTGESTIVIATRAHLDALEGRLESYGIDINGLIFDDRYIPLDAEKVLAMFMVKDWPDETLFMQTVSAILVKARGDSNRKIRAFGEMVALLWARGLNGATVRLEYLWNKFCEKETFCLFCAYPKPGFTDDLAESIHHICNAHSKIIEGTQVHLTDVYYRDIKKATS